MPTPTLSSSNFSHLQQADPQLMRLGLLAEKYLAEDPNTSLIKMRQFAELLAQTVAARMGVYQPEWEGQYELLRRLQDEGVLSREIAQLFDEIRRAGNEANHALTADPARALNVLKLGWQLGVWYQRAFLKTGFQCGAFIPPAPAPETAAERRAQRAELERQALPPAQTQAALAEQQAQAKRKQARTFQKYRYAAQAASDALDLDEPATRQIIDGQLRRAGWQADSARLRFGAGARPERGKNQAIAEWPTLSGPADYVLFVGLTPVAVVEAKRKNVDVSAALVQAKRYSRDIEMVRRQVAPGGPWGDYQIPFAFSSNGRPYLRQMKTLSGIWFVDLRDPNNISHALDGWYTPEGLLGLLKRDEAASHRQLRAEPFDYGFTLRPYQIAAIRAVERGIAEGKREMLLAMATGTGKTKTCIALIYRLLKVKRFRRVLFLVDREALGEQAANAFKDTRMDSLQSFADIFGLQALDAAAPETETAVHIATVQGMVRRILYPTDDADPSDRAERSVRAPPPPVDQYDCIVVDECHRGYLLDRELSDTELTFRSFEDYVSKYRRVLDYFDAVKIGLTATPALHTTEIFGMPVYTYSYREAVIDGYLVDHEPPLQIVTALSKDGITWKAGESVKVYNPRLTQLELFTTPDEIKVEVEAFNRKVMTVPFNQVVCDYLAQEIDPFSRQKTLIFCVQDTHADLVVHLLKKAYQARYGGIEDDAIAKITGTVDKPLEMIRRYKNERNPNIAVTVDLLTTGVDVPEICNLVFLRRVNSRILFEQMLGRATRPCPEVEKECFRVFDAVRLYEALEGMTEMRPVVADPNASFSQLMAEYTTVKDAQAREMVREQLIAKFQRKKSRLTEQNAQDFETAAGMRPDDFVGRLRELSPDEMAAWFVENPQLGEILDRVNASSSRVLISEHKDALYGVERGYGRAAKPADYIEEFRTYLRTERDRLPALVTVLTRPRDLTRRQLRELALELDRAGFSETSLTTAWREMTNQDIAAHIVGFIRHIATGDPLVPYEARVDWALGEMLKARAWSTPQRQWLHKIAAQTKANVVVDREALDDPDLIFRVEGGGFTRLDRLFEGRLARTLSEFNELLWKTPKTQ